MNCHASVTQAARWQAGSCCCNYGIRSTVARIWACLQKLLSELPSILNWALAGLDRLRARGYFVQPASARQAVDELEELASPMIAFRAARCIVGADERADCDSLYLDWVSWCREQGRSQPGSKAIFSRDLHAAIPGLQSDSAVGQRRQPAAQVPRRRADRRGNRDASERPGSASGATRMTPLPSRWSAMRGCGPLTVRHAGRRNSLIVHGSPPCPLKSENPRARKSRYNSMCISVGSNTMGWQADMANSAEPRAAPATPAHAAPVVPASGGSVSAADTIPTGIMTPVIISNVMITGGIITRVGKGAEAAPRANPQNAKIAELPNSI